MVFDSGIDHPQSCLHGLTEQVFHRCFGLLVETPELGSVDSVSPEWIQAEYDIRRQFGKSVEMAELGLVFPQSRRPADSESCLHFYPDRPTMTFMNHATLCPVAIEGVVQ